MHGFDALAATSDERQLVPTATREEQGSSPLRLATDGDGKCVDRGGGFGRVAVALPPLIWKIGSCL